MQNIAKLYPSGSKSQHFKSAVVVETCDKQGYIAVNSNAQDESRKVYARIAVPLLQPLIKGDEVLIAGENVDDLYVIGVLSNNAPQVQLPHRQDIGNGAYVMIDESKQASTLQVFSSRNELIVEYDPESDKTRINVEKGNLEFTTQDGDIVFDTSKNIRLKGNTIELASRSNIQLSVTDALGQLISSLSIRPKRLKLSSAQINMTAQKGEVHIKETRYLGKIFRGTVEDSKLIAGKLTTIANSITEKAKNVYKTVEQLSQLRAGRMRTLVDSSFHLKAKKTYMKAEESFKINADKIHLG